MVILNYKIIHRPAGAGTATFTFPLIHILEALRRSNKDIEGKARPTPANTNPDMGAYENDLGSQWLSQLLRMYLQVLRKNTSLEKV